MKRANHPWLVIQTRGLGEREVESWDPFDFTLVVLYIKMLYIVTPYVLLPHKYTHVHRDPGTARAHEVQRGFPLLAPCSR